MKKLLLLSIMASNMSYASWFTNFELPDLSLPTVEVTKSTTVGAVKAAIKPLSDFCYDNMVLSGATAAVIALSAYKIGQYSAAVYIDKDSIQPTVSLSVPNYKKPKHH